MLRSFIGINPIKSLVTTGLSLQQTRNTFILKRRYPPGLHKKSVSPRTLKGRHFVYDLVEFAAHRKQDDMPVLLTQYCPGVGDVGDVVLMRGQTAYNEFLLTGLGVYCTPENAEKYKQTSDANKNLKAFSSPYVERTLSVLSKFNLQITMSKTHPWVLEPWHIRASFRKANHCVPEHAITMPPGEIRGPDLSLQDKEFFITVTVNKKEKVNVRCTIHHWAVGKERLPWVENHWKMQLEPLFSEQAEILNKMHNPDETNTS